MKKIFYTAIAFVTLLSVAMTLEKTIKPEESARNHPTLGASYVNSKFDYSINYPNTFELREYPDDYPSPNIEEVTSVQIIPPATEYSGAIYLLKADHYAPEDNVDNLSYENFSSLFRERQISCDKENKRLNSQIGKLERITVSEHVLNRFSIREGFHQYNQNRCGGMGLGKWNYQAYLLQNTEGVKFILLTTEDDVGEAIIKSFKTINSDK